MKTNSFNQAIQNRINSLKRSYNYMVGAIAKAPRGKINCSRQRGQYRYYKVDSDKKYISDKQVIKELIQKEYYEKLTPRIKSEISTLQSLLEHTADQEAEILLRKMHPGKRPFITSNYKIDANQEYINKWLAQPYESNVFGMFDPEHYSLSGIRTRSKSEAEIINVLEARGIPFRYEYPVKINDINTRYPDFMCMNPRTLEIIYWEHWGRMDDADYVNKQIQKLKDYRKVGIILGVNLFITIETRNNPLNTITINEFIDDHLI